VNNLTLVVVFFIMPIAIYAALAAFAGGLLALAVYHAAFVRPALARATSLLGVHDELIGGGAGAAGRLDGLGAEFSALKSSVVGELAALGTTLGRVEGRVSEVEALARTDISRIGFVRYDAFDDTGSELSYAVALLNRRGDGVVISSIYSRSDTRTFGKAVQGYKPAVNASEEELLAIERARTSRE